MTTIGSLLDVSNNITHCDFPIEQLIIPTIDVPQIEFLCGVGGLDSPWYQEIYGYKIVAQENHTKTHNFQFM